MSAVDRVLEHVEGVQEKGNGFWALCPAHEDHNPSLHIQEGDDGRALVICRAGCDQERVMTALETMGLRRGDLFSGTTALGGHATRARRAHGGRERLVRSYEVKDETGVLRGTHERWEVPGDSEHKSFRWRLPDGRYSKGDIDPTMMPLYGAELVGSWPKGCRVVLSEGETPAEALRKAGIRALGTVCGAGSAPKREVLEVLAGYEVIVWPDNDARGLEHMRRCAAELKGIATALRWFEWPEAPPKGDGADHPAITGEATEAIEELAQQLGTAPFFEVGEDAGGIVSRFERIDLGEPIESGMEPAEMLVPDVLYAGSVHGIYSAGGKGKTFFALWLMKQVIEQERPVMLLDQENGVRIISERLRALGLSAEQARRNLYYYPFPSMPLEAGAAAEFGELLDEVRPALIVLDSWINFLASAGLEENSSVDIAHWADAYSQKARQRGMAILLLDHIPKEGNTARGSGRKLDYVDVMWELTKPQDFDRETVGRIDLRLKKDREGWMPWGVAFTVGGSEGGLIFARTAFDSSRLAPNSLLPSDRTTLDALKSFGSSGVRDKDWREEAMKRGIARTTYYRSRGNLKKQGLVEEVMGKFFHKTPAKQESHSVSQESHGTNGTRTDGGKSHESHAPKGWDHGTNQAGAPHRDPEAWEWTI